ncbi:MAG: hypothetical protein HQ508_01470 [Candidatus Marinimicrobia bacterium]|nr:hypothetical protein [Candidatus Neomarinimicrobiota bacterium]
MKRTRVTLWFVVVLIFVGCDNTITNPNQGDQVYNSPGNGFLAKAPVYVADLDSTLPSGTQYTLPTDSNIWYYASGGEMIAGGCKTRNKYDSAYKVHLYAEMKVRFDQVSSVTIDNPSYLDYLTSSGSWIGILVSSTVSAQAVRTDSLGSGSITLSSTGSFEDADEHYGN